MSYPFYEFIVEELDSISEPSETTVLKNEQFRKNLEIEIQKFASIPCECSSHGSTVSVLRGGEIVEMPSSVVLDGDLVLSPIEAVNNEETSSVIDEPFEFRVIILSHDGLYKATVLIVRRCKRCGDIRFRGDIDALITTIGFAYMKVLDYEQKNYPSNEDRCNDCDRCTSCDSCGTDTVVTENDKN